MYGPEAAFDEEVGYTAPLPERVAIQSAFLRLFEQYRDILHPNSTIDAYENWAEVLLAFEGEMQRLVRSEGWIGIDADGKPSEFTTKAIARALSTVV